MCQRCRATALERAIAAFRTKRLLVKSQGRKPVWCLRASKLVEIADSIEAAIRDDRKNMVKRQGRKPVLVRAGERIW